jgi:hypothetical protein
MEHLVLEAKTDTTEPPDLLDLKEKLVPLVLLFNQMFLAQLAHLVTLVKMEPLALLVALDPLAPLALLDPEALLVKMVLLVTRAALVPREKLEILVTTELQAKTDSTVPLVLTALLGHEDPLALQATMALLVKMVPMA